MNRIHLVIFATVTIAPPAFADNPTMFAPGPGGPPIEGGRDVCWSEPGDPGQNMGSSEVIGEFGVESEIANDFFFEEDTVISLARWWGGYWNGDPADFRMNLRFYADGGCVPTDVLAEWLDLDANQTEVDNYYVYHHSVMFQALGGTRYWFVAQAADHLFPPQWGRLGTSDYTDCSTLFRSEYFSYPDWTPEDPQYGVYEASQEFECEAGTAAARTTLGAVKALYR